VKASGLGRSGAPDEVLQTSSGTRPPSSSTPSDRNGAVRMVETPLSHSQPHSVTCGSTIQPYVVPHGELRHVEACKTM
jgi:hypothetical protein